MVVEFIGVTICATLLVLWFAYMSSGKFTANYKSNTFK